MKARTFADWRFHLPNLNPGSRYAHDLLYWHQGLLNQLKLFWKLIAKRSVSFGGIENKGIEAGVLEDGEAG